MKIVVKYIKDIEKKIGTQNTYIQIKRGLFKTNSGKIINADVNGSINILRKYIKEVFSPKLEIRVKILIFTFVLKV